MGDSHSVESFPQTHPTSGSLSAHSCAPQPTGRPRAQDVAGLAGAAPAEALNKTDLTTARTDKFIVDELDREIEAGTAAASRRRDGAGHRPWWSAASADSRSGWLRRSSPASVDMPTLPYVCLGGQLGGSAKLAR